MNEEKGYIKLFRSITDNFLWEDRATKLQAWLDLLMMVNYRDKKTYFNNRLVEVKRGEIITSERKLAERWKWDKRTVKKFLETLQAEKMITFIVEENICTTINIVNYCKYQGFSENDVPPNVPLIVPPITPLDAPPNVPPNVPNIKKDNKGEESKEGEESIYLSNNSNELLDCPSEEQPDEEKHGAYDDLLKLWNSLDQYGIQPIRAITKQRLVMLKPRLREYGRESFAECIEQIKQSDFLQGKHNGKPWAITFDWMIRPTNYPKVLEGNYNKKGNAAGNNQSSYLQDILGMMKGDSE